ncbi:MAG: hypothetical protein FJ108_09775 [Deltaproteobacteria bacterium]|nr:hypothetical protein [Deltaproteobacteria bacterium]
MLPPIGCEYLSPDEVHEIIAGLPPGTTIQLAPIHKDFMCREPGSISPPGSCTVSMPPGTCEAAGGSLAGTVDCSPTTAEFELTGTGDLAGFHRIVSVPLQMEVHAAPRTAGAPIQSFDTAMMFLQGQLPPGDPDFDLLRITGGQFHGMPSPGHTTLTLRPSGKYEVDSFFDITYRIDFIGAPGGPLAGSSGSTTGTIRMETGSTSAVPAVPKPSLTLVGLILLAGAALFIPRLRRKAASA